MKKSMVFIAAVLGLAGFNAAQAGNSDLLLGFNDAASIVTSAQNDYVIDLGMTAPTLLTLAAANGGTYVFTNAIDSATFSTAYGVDDSYLTDVAVGVVSGYTTGTSQYLYQTGPNGTSGLRSWTTSNESTWENAAVYAQAPDLGEYASADTTGWSSYIAASPTSIGSNLGGSVAGLSGNPTTNLISGEVVIPFFKSTFNNIGRGAPAPTAWTQVGTFDINANSGNVTFTASGSGPSAPVVTSITGSATNVFAHQAVVFTDSVTGTGTNWVWTFGDGNSVTNTSGVSVTNAYAATGSYTVALTVSGPGGSGTLSLTNYITVYPTPQIVAASLSGGRFVISGSNGPSGVPYHIISSTNLKTPLTNWVTVYTSALSGTGTFSFTNSTTNAASFFKLVSP